MIGAKFQKFQEISWFEEDVENSRPSASVDLLFLSLLLLHLPNWDGQGSSFRAKTMQAAPEPGPFNSVHANPAILALIRLLVSTSSVNNGFTSSTPLHSIQAILSETCEVRLVAICRSKE